MARAAKFKSARRGGVAGSRPGTLAGSGDGDEGQYRHQHHTEQNTGIHQDFLAIVHVAALQCDRDEGT